MFGKRKKIRKIETVVVRDEPAWTPEDARNLAGFLGTSTGRALVLRMQHQLLQRCMTPGLEADDLAECRAIQMQIRFVEGHANVAHWDAIARGEAPGPDDDDFLYDDAE